MTGLTSLDEALAIMLSNARPLPPETIRIEDSHGRTLAAPVFAAIASPRSDSSAMDGYAVRNADVVELPARLEITGESFAGTAQPPDLGVGEAVQIFTGAPVPDGADRVVIQENCSRDGDTVTVREFGPGHHVRKAGQDFEEGQELLPAGTRLTPRALVAAAGADQAIVSVVRRPRVAILGTGDELVPPGEARQRPGTIPESISLALTAMVADAGGRVVRRTHSPDDMSVLTGVAQEALTDADLVVVTGGASVGERDHARDMFGDELEMLFSKVGMKPGKPVWLGRHGRTLILGLPGNPTSAIVTARLFLMPLVAGLAGRSPRNMLDWRTGIAGADFPENGSRETLARARWFGDQLVPLDSQESGSQSVLVHADALVRRMIDAPGILPGEALIYLDL
ncbi:MAG: molybdopterin molybdotransferase MoeA [Qipengyuania sp.]